LILVADGDFIDADTGRALRAFGDAGLLKVLDPTASGAYGITTLVLLEPLRTPDRAMLRLNRSFAFNDLDRASFLAAPG
jgi:hypothetical protein